PGGLQVDQERDAGAGAVEVVEGQLDAEPAGDGEQVDDGVGGAADGGQGDDRVEERGAGHHLAGPAALADHLDHEAAGVVRALQQPAVGGGGAGGAGDGHAERLGHDGHGGGGAHGVAVPAAADHGGLGLQERLAGELPGPYLLAEPPHVGAAAERDAAEMAGEHGPAEHHDGGQVDGGGGHQQGRDGLVAAAEQHDAVDRVGAQHLLGGHGGEVAPEHGGGPDVGLADGDGGQVERDSAGRPDALFDAVGGLGGVGGAGGQVGGGAGDGHVRPRAGEGVAGRAAADPGAVERGVPVVACAPLRGAKRPEPDLGQGVMANGRDQRQEAP